MDDFILKNCTFIPELTEGYDKTTGELRVSGGRIAEIAEHIDGSDAEGYDMQGRTVMPGLIDLHTHFVQWSSHSCYEAPVMDPCDVVMKYYKHGMIFMEQGYTTIRDCGSDYRGVNALARALDEGILYGPRVIPCGLIVTPTEVGNDTFSGMYHEADGPEEFKKAAREEFKHGAKFLKIMSSGAFTNKGGIPKQSIIDRDEVQAAVHVAKMKGSYVASHCHSADAIVMAAEEGVRTIEHGSFLDDKGIELLKGNTDTCTNIISPIEYYVPVIMGLLAAYNEKPERKVGIGTVVSMMIPYSIAFFIGLIALLFIFYFFDLPIGPGVGIYL